MRRLCGVSQNSLHISPQESKGHLGARMISSLLQVSGPPPLLTGIQPQQRLCEPTWLTGQRSSSLQAHIVIRALELV